MLWKVSLREMGMFVSANGEVFGHEGGERGQDMFWEVV